VLQTTRSNPTAPATERSGLAVTSPKATTIDQVAGDLALDGDAVRRIVGPAPGPHIGDALRWLESQVLANPQLNTPQALTALLRFRSPASGHVGQAKPVHPGRRTPSPSGVSPDRTRRTRRSGTSSARADATRQRWWMRG
jgi:hypothetical protein